MNVWVKTDPSSGCDPNNAAPERVSKPHMHEDFRTVSGIEGPIDWQL